MSFYLAAIPAVTLLGMSKGGFAGVGMLGLPLMALAIPPLHAAAIILPVLLVQDAFSVWVYRRTWDARNLSVLLPGAALGVIVGYLLAARVSNAGVCLAVGAVSALFAGARLIKAPAEPLAGARPSKAAGVVCGALSGFTSMIAHAGAPPFQIYVLPQRLERDVFVGTSVVFFAAVNWMKIWPFFALGQMTRESIVASFSLFPLALVSTWGGVLLVRRFSAERLARALYVILLLIGLKLIWDGMSGLPVHG
jgi:uncharacterized membrane protein YfcA